MSQFCWNKFATSVIFPSSLLEVVNNLFANLFQQLGTISAKTTCQQLANRPVKAHTDRSRFANATRFSKANKTINGKKFGQICAPNSLNC